MLSQIFHPLRTCAELLSAENGPRRIAFGIAMGMVLGLVPKGNLTFATLGVVLWMTRANLAAAGTAIAVFTWLGVWTAPLAHRIGYALLTAGWVQPIGAWLYDRPLFPWTCLNNTVVLGSLALGLVLAYPVYHVVYQVFERRRPWIRLKLAKYQAAEVPAAAEAAEQRRLG